LAPRADVPIDLPTWRVPRLPGGIAGESPLAGLPWSAIPPLPPFQLADGSGPARQQTTARLAWDDAALYARFDCADRDAWGTMTRRDDPIYQEEVVELFLAPGAAVPPGYFELEVSPLGTLFDAWIDNPDSRRDTMRIGTEWDCPGVRCEAGKPGRRQDWWAALALPWSGLVPAGPRPAVWRANLYRIERPRDGSPAELSAWSPTLAIPPEFHRPARFGFLELVS
jgi:hypothetical protein